MANEITKLTSNIHAQGNTLTMRWVAMKPKMRTALQPITKTIAERFYQLLSGHGMAAPFLKDKWKWVDSGRC